MDNGQDCYELKRICEVKQNSVVDIEFTDLSYAVKDRGEKRILKSVSGKFYSGELTAILGASGAGKTTLLNVLSGFITKGVTGTIQVNDIPRNLKTFRKISAYIMEENLLHAYLSVEESMVIAARLKLGDHISLEQKRAKVLEILDILGLEYCLETRCNNLSGGERKRLSIALEMVSNPPVIFLDGPTSGLDAFSIKQCMGILNVLKEQGRTVIFTIDQPSDKTFQSFDQVYFLHGGMCIYSGSTSNIVPFLSSVGYQCPVTYCPVDYLLEVANEEYGNVTEQLAKRSTEINWRNGTSRCNVENINQSGDIDIPQVSVRPATEWTRFVVLLHRSVLQLYRERSATLLKLLLNILVGVCVGLLFFNVGNDAERSRDNVCTITIALVYLSYSSLMPAILRFPAELAILRKEKFNNWHNLKIYYVAFMVVDIPVQVLLCTTYTSITYLMTSQPHEWFRFFMYLNIACLVTITAESFGILIGSVTHPTKGTFIGTLYLVLTIVLSGLVILIPHMSRYCYFFSFTSYLRYGMEGFAQSLYGYDRGAIPCPEEVYCYFGTSKIILNTLGTPDDNRYWISVYVLLGMIVFLRILTFCILKRNVTKG